MSQANQKLQLSRKAWCCCGTASQLHRSTQNSVLELTHLESLVAERGDFCKFEKRMECHP